jgi:rubredoxin---NAD+ reductase
MTSVAWRQFICKACSYVYDEEAGDPDSGLAPGTRFEDIPDDWYCPICGVTKADFALDQSMPVVNRSASPTLATVSRGQKIFDVLIVGGGVAGWSVAHALRERSDEVSIGLVSDCDAHRYDKPQISVAFANGTEAQALIKQTGLDAARSLGVELFPQTVAVSLNTTRNQLRTTRGVFSYRNLVLAHGAESILPTGLPANQCWRINHLDHYRRFRQALGSDPQQVLIVGAGLVGCELANDLALAGHSPILVDIADQPLKRLCPDENVIKPLLKAWEALPIKFIGGVSVEHVASVDGQKGVGLKEVRLSNGESLQINHILVCAGLKVPSRIARSAGLAWDNGLRVDERTLRTSVHNIYALGDCAVVSGHINRFIEPIARQAQAIAGEITGTALEPYENRAPIVRVKTSSYRFSVGS